MTAMQILRELFALRVEADVWEIGYGTIALVALWCHLAWKRFSRWLDEVPEE